MSSESCVSDRDLTMPILPLSLIQFGGWWPDQRITYHSSGSDHVYTYHSSVIQRNTAFMFPDITQGTQI